MLRVARSGACAGSPASRRSGFTLLEIAGTLAVLTVIALAVCVALVAMARHGRIHREVSVANLEARRVLEEIQATPFGDLVERFPDGSQQSIPQLPGGLVAVDYADPEVDPLQVQVQVSWSSTDLGSMVRVYETARTE